VADPEAEPDPIAVMWRHVQAALAADKNPSPTEIAQRAAAAGCDLSSTTISEWFAVWPTEPKRVVPRRRTFEAFVRALSAEKDRDWGKLWDAANQAKAAEKRTRNSSSPTAAETPRAGSRWRSWAGVAVATLVVAAVVVILAGVVLPPPRSGPSGSTDPLSGTAPGGSTGTPPQRTECALVNAETSPVFVGLGDTTPLKVKYWNDRVTLVNLTNAIDGVMYQAVRLPAAGESPTGYGWMRAGDLIATSCEGPVQLLPR
jgi:hypothetical protein